MSDNFINTIKEFRRVIGIPEILFLAGQRLKKLGIKYTAVATLLSVGMILANTLGEHVIEDINVPVSNLQAIMLTVVVALVTFGMGNTLTGISNLFSTQKIMFADANSMNLMEDRKKTDILEHLGILWDRVFQYEARLQQCEPGDEELKTIETRRRELKERIERWPDDLKRHFGINDINLDELVLYIAQFQPLGATLETTKDGFLATASFSARQAMPQKLEKHLCGFDLTLLEDWYDGAYLSGDDSKLGQQYAAHSVIRGIRLTLGIPWIDRVKETLTGYPNPVWHTLTMKKIAMCAGTHINRMNKQYTRDIEPDYFNAQDFLWKNDELDRLILHYFPGDGPDILHDLRQARQDMFRKIFSPDKQKAHKQIFRMFGRDYVNALNLRLDFDLEFAAGQLAVSPAEDLDELHKFFPCEIYNNKKLNSKVEKSVDILQESESFLSDYLSELSHNLPALRAFRTGYFVNMYKIREIITKSPKKAINIIENKMLPAEKRFSQRICLLRQHYELSRMQLLYYVNMIDELAEYG